MQNNVPNTQPRNNPDLITTVLKPLSLSVQETIAVTVQPNDLACQQSVQDIKCESENLRMVSDVPIKLRCW